MFIHHMVHVHLSSISISEKNVQLQKHTLFVNRNTLSNKQKKKQYIIYIVIAFSFRSNFIRDGKSFFFLPGRLISLRIELSAGLLTCFESNKKNCLKANKFFNTLPIYAFFAPNSTSWHRIFVQHQQQWQQQQQQKLHTNCFCSARP